MEIILHPKIICTHHDYPSTLFHPQLHKVQLSLASHSGSICRYEPSLGDIIGFESKTEDKLGLKRSLRLAWHIPCHTLSDPTDAVLLFSTTSPHLGRVIELIPPVPHILSCTPHRRFLVLTISPRDLCLHYNPISKGGNGAH